MRPEDVGKREGSLTGEEMGGEKVKFALKKGARGSVGEVIAYFFTSRDRKGLQW
jgi:hypothetical protein